MNDLADEKKEILSEVSQKKSVESKIEEHYLEGYRDGAEDALNKVSELSPSPENLSERKKTAEKTEKTPGKKFEPGDRVRLSEEGMENLNTRKADDPSEIEGTVKGVSDLGIRVNWDYLKGNSSYYHFRDELKKVEEHSYKGDKGKFSVGDEVELSEKGIKNFRNPHKVSDVSKIKGEVLGVTEKGVRVNWNYLGSDTGYYHREDELRNISKDKNKEKEQENYTCEVCGKTLDTEKGKKIHKSKVHESSSDELTEDSTERKILEAMKEEEGFDGAVSVEKISSKLGMMAEKVFQFLRGMEKKGLVEKANVKGDIKRRYRIKTADRLGGS